MSHGVCVHIRVHFDSDSVVQFVNGVQCLVLVVDVRVDLVQSVLAGFYFSDQVVFEGGLSRQVGAGVLQVHLG